MRPAESFVAQPIRSLQTMLRVIAEADGGLPTLVPDGIYGQSTINAVSAFQRRQGLPVTGVTDQQTWDAIVPVYEDALISVAQAQAIEVDLEPNQVFRRGDSGPYILLAQAMLQSLAKLNYPIDEPSHTGVLDAATIEALISFQILAGLLASGELDRKTWKHLVLHFVQDAGRQSRG